MDAILTSIATGSNEVMDNIHNSEAIKNRVGMDIGLTIVSYLIIRFIIKCLLSTRL